MLVNFATGVEVYASPLIIELLTFFGTWRSPADLAGAMPNAPREMLDSVVSALIERTLLQVEGRVPPAEQAMQQWEPWNPSAGFFHHATRDVPYTDAGTSARARAGMPKRTRRELVKRIDGADTTALPRPATATEFSKVLLARRTWRHFARGAVALDDLSTLLHLTAGVQRWERTIEGPAVLKTSPSGGATHPGELYVFALHVDRLKRGIYHYRADTHALELIRAGGRRTDVERYLPTQSWYNQSAFLVFFSAVFARSLWRYNYARAYRALLIEAGHMCQTFCLTATSLGLAPFCVMALADSAIEKDLGLDGRTESVLYAAGAGQRPTGVEWAPSPHEAWPGARQKRQKRHFSGRAS